ncbi:helix-turn-helix domain-containing protein [Pseudochrobactrum lubricantis]|uniref:helix-turn-helix domain-containing protein n=1 Tax=Pseudochrobactrum lubricantis TaxID=558172 RepID=UPI0035DF483B
MKIVEIAQECGFSDQVHLTKFFTRVVGITPARFRKKNSIISFYEFYLLRISNFI